MKHLVRLLPLLLLLLTSCKPTIPGEYLQPDEMEDVLYDYHLAQAMGVQMLDGGRTPSDIDQNVYKMAALRKHGLTEAQFDHSLAYYMRHTDELHRIYEDLAQRYSDDAVSLGASVNDINQFGDAQQGDTTNVWNKAQAIVLTTYEGMNQESFTLKGDTAYHKGDKLMLNFDTQFIVQDGSRDLVAVMAVTFQNDSTVQQLTRVSGNSHYSITIDDRDRLGIKKVRGFFLLNRGENDSETTLKLICLYNIRLVRMHTPQEKKQENNEKDSLPQAPRLQPMPRPSGR